MDRYKRYTPRVYPCPRPMPDTDVRYCVCTSQPVSLAMGYVPVQEFKNLYNCAEALSKGTLFAELNMPVCNGGCRR